MTAFRVTSPISLRTAFSQCSLHANSRPFCNKFVSGFAIFAKFGIMGGGILEVECASNLLIVVRVVGQSVIRRFLEQHQLFLNRLMRILPNEMITADSRQEDYDRSKNLRNHGWPTTLTTIKEVRSTLGF